MTMNHDEHDEAIAPDIQETLDDVRGVSPSSDNHDADEGVVHSDGLLALSPRSKNPVMQLLWGIKSSGAKSCAMAKKHPWIAGLGIIGSFALAPLCIYASICGIAGLMIAAIRQNSTKLTD